MQSTMLRTLKSTTTLLIVTLFLLGNYAYSQWTPAPAGPPGSNVPAPINVGSDNQVKLGALDISAQKITGGVPTIFLNDTTAGHRNFWLQANSNSLSALTSRSGDPNTSSGAYPMQLVVGKSSNGIDDQVRFPGQVAANEYCDVDGNNCAPAGGGFIPGMVMAFNLTTCPTGWVEANGAGGTPDLRGRFIRGINGDQNGSDVARSLGSYQGDQFASHSHMQTSGFGGSGGPYWRANATISSGPLQVSDSTQTRDAGGSETRPKNVALLYCVKA